MKALIKKYPEKGIWMEDVPNPNVEIMKLKLKLLIRPYVVQIYIFIIGIHGHKER